MNISWSDLNNVQNAGDYPFRDGTISVTFAEVAIWKTNPHAQFRLMRKHPIQSAFKYVLGRQIEENLAADDAEFIYESSNGDSWCLTRDPATGAQAVMHRPNPQSGGQVSYIGIEKFLSEGANGAEQQALRRLMEKPRMATILIAHDIHPPRGGAYDDLINAIQSLGPWWHHLETIWIVQCAHTPREIRDRLKSRHCFERDVTEGRSMSWYIDLDEGNLEDEITLGPIRNVDCRQAHKHSRTPPPDRDRTGSSHSRKTSSSSGRRMANEIGLGANSNE